jgi:rod shape-determining protein MreC
LAVLRDSGVRPPVPRFSALGLKAFVLCALSVAIIVVDHRHQHLQMIRSGLTAAVYPLQVLVHSPIAAYERWRETVASREALLAENQALKAAVRRDDILLLRLEAEEHENARLRLLLNAAPRAAPHVAAATVLRVDLDALRQRVLIDKGTRDNVFKGQAVLDSRGVFGQVTNVGPVSAEVILLSDSSHAIPVQVSRNELRTIATGTGDPRRLALNFLPRAADVKTGDILLSSGLGGVFPAGYPVGRIAEVRRDASQPLLSVVVEPYAGLDSAQEVLLVWFDQPPAPPPPPEVPKPESGRRRGTAASPGKPGDLPTAPSTPTPSARAPSTASPAPAPAGRNP